MKIVVAKTTCPQWLIGYSCEVRRELRGWLEVLSVVHHHTHSTNRVWVVADDVTHGTAGVLLGRPITYEVSHQTHVELLGAG